MLGEPAGADRGEILGEHLFPNLRERKFAQRAPSAARTSTVVATTYDHKEVTVKAQTRMASLSLLTILCLGLAAAPARAGILYDNGPINGAVNRQDIKHGSGNAVSGSFFLTAGMSNLESVHFGMWTEVEARPSTVEWEIGSTPFAADKGFGTATLTWNYVGYNGGCCDITEASFTFPSINLGPGQYWLTLSNAVACGPFGCDGVVGWDENSGAGCGGTGGGANCPSTAYFDNTGNPIPSESFTIDGTSTPEPYSIALFGSGVLGLGGVLRRRLMG